MRAVRKRMKRVGIISRNKDKKFNYFSTAFKADIKGKFFFGLYVGKKRWWRIRGNDKFEFNNKSKEKQHVWLFMNEKWRKGSKKRWKAHVEGNIVLKRWHFDRRKFGEMLAHPCHLTFASLFFSTASAGNCR